MPLPNQAHLSVVIPVYNEVESLPILHARLTGVLERLSPGWEIIYVDDGSDDGSTDALLALQAADARVTVVVQRRNFGKSLALNAGFALARGDVLVTMDADLQDEPDEMERLLAKLAEGYDVVSGWKKERHDPLSKRIPSRIANRVTAWMTGLRLRDMNSGYKVYRSEVVRRLRIYGDLHRYIPVLAHYAGFRVTEVPVTHHARRFGRSKYGPGRLLRGGLDLVTVLFLNQYGRRPLHLFGGLGGLLLLAGFLINLVLSIEWFMGVRPLSERPVLFLGVLLMLMGAQFLTMGLLAELIVSHMQRSEDPLVTTARVYRAEQPVGEAQPQ